MTSPSPPAWRLALDRATEAYHERVRYAEHLERELRRKNDLIERLSAAAASNSLPPSSLAVETPKLTLNTASPTNRNDSPKQLPGGAPMTGVKRAFSPAAEPATSQHLPPLPPSGGDSSLNTSNPTPQTPPLSRAYAKRSGNNESYASPPPLTPVTANGASASGGPSGASNFPPPLGTIIRKKSSSISFSSQQHHQITSDRPIAVGVCAMAKKANCKPMREILGRLPHNEFTVTIFDERMILEDPVASWPVVDVLIAFYSAGFPMDKAVAYQKLRDPFMVNDLVSQRWLWDRRTVYRVCELNGIAVPQHLIVNRDQPDGTPDDEIVEGDDFIEVPGKGRIEKPFVEKPVDADDHNVYIYYPRSSGGGRKELFRKVGDRSSEYFPERDRVRRDGSYIYEKFMTTEGTDVKVYAVTGEYAHAEARKSPVMDGRVMRDDSGVEVRYPIILGGFEKDLCRRVVAAFRQRVCGFDMLRSGGKTYVCDVNGWSFVKRSTRYHKDAALMLARLMRHACGRPDVVVNDSIDVSSSEEEEEDDGGEVEEVENEEHLQRGGGEEEDGPIGPDGARVVSTSHGSISIRTRPVPHGGKNETGVGKRVLELQRRVTPPSAGTSSEISHDTPVTGTSSGVDKIGFTSAERVHRSTSSSAAARHEELRAVIAIVRHGDRTPKQKLKMRVRDERFLAMLGSRSEVKLKTAKDLGNVLDIVRSLLEPIPERPNTPEGGPTHLQSHPDSTSSGGIALGGSGGPTPLIAAALPNISSNNGAPAVDDTGTPPPEATEEEEEEEALLQARAVLEMHGSFKGINRKVQLKCLKTSPPAEDGTVRPVEAQLIIKWGGVLTPAGREHAEQIGRSFRERVYPGDGLLRLHSTYRHDLKIYSSDEGRVQVTAAAFVKGLLDLEGHLTPILASLVKKGPDVNLLLNDTSQATAQMEAAKAGVRKLLLHGTFKNDRFVIGNTTTSSSTTSENETDRVEEEEEEVVVEETDDLALSRTKIPNSVIRACRNLKKQPTEAMEELYVEIKGFTLQLKKYVRSLRISELNKPVERGSVAAPASINIRKASFRRTSSELGNISTTLLTGEGGSAAASLGEINLGEGTKLDRGDGAVTVPDMIQLAYARWEKLHRDFFRLKTRTFDVSKIPDIYDCVKYDVIHNPELLRLRPPLLHRIYIRAKNLADIVVPEEYGIAPLDKLEFGVAACTPLLNKIVHDLTLASGEGYVAAEMSNARSVSAAPNPPSSSASSSSSSAAAGVANNVNNTSQNTAGGGESNGGGEGSTSSGLPSRASRETFAPFPPPLTPTPATYFQSEFSSTAPGNVPPPQAIPIDRSLAGTVTPMPSEAEANLLIEEANATEHRLDKRHAKKMGIKSFERHVRTRLYFTSESHLHSILNVLRYAHIVDESIPAPSMAAMHRMEEVDELNYLSHILIRMFEVEGEVGDKRFSLRVSFSNGVGVDVRYDGDGIIKEVVVGNNPVATGASGKSVASTKSAVDVTGTSVTGDSSILSVKPHRVSGRQLPPANPLVSLWSDLPLATGLKVLTVNPKAVSSTVSANSGTTPLVAPTAVSASSALGGWAGSMARANREERRNDGGDGGGQGGGGGSVDATPARNMLTHTRGGWGSGAFPTPGARAFVDESRENVAEETVLSIRGVLTRTETAHFHDNLHEETDES